nr:MAG: NinG protein [Bacteriophage sp.]
MSIKFNFNSFKTVGKKESTRKGNGSVKRICAFCGKEFITYTWRGAGKYCSHKCATNATKVEHIPNVKCCVCNKPIYIKPSRLERSKTKMFTCSKECMGKMRSKIFVGELNPNYNNINNLIPLTRSEHTSIHNNEKTIIRDVNGKIKTVVFKQGELLETHNGNDNQQPSISSNAFKGSTTNSRIQTDNAEDSNADTSALPSINTSDDIV